MKSRRAVIKGEFSQLPSDVWSGVDGGKPIGNGNKFPLDSRGKKEVEVIREVNQNRNDITQRAASELRRIAREVSAGISQEKRWDTDSFPVRMVHPENEYKMPRIEEPVSEVTHSQSSILPQE